MGGSNLAQAATNYFKLIQFTAIPGMKPLSCPHFVATKGDQEQFPGKRVWYFFDQTTRLLAARFCVATIRGRRLFHWKVRRHQ